MKSRSSLAVASPFPRSSPSRLLTGRASGTHARRSAGLVVYRHAPTGALEVLLCHQGGPLLATKDGGAWSVPHGVVGEDEGPLAVARRQFGAALGVSAPNGPAVDLGFVVTRSGVRLHGFGIEGTLEVGAVTGSTFELEWPPGSGQVQTFPEVDRAAWFDADEARAKLTAVQQPFLLRLLALDRGVRALAGVR